MKKLFFICTFVMAAMTTNAGEPLTYEVFLNIYQDLVNEKSYPNNPSQAFLNKYSLTIKKNEYNEWIMGKGFTYSNYEAKATDSHAWWISYNVGECGNLSLHFAESGDIKKFWDDARSYGLGQAIVSYSPGGDLDEAYKNVFLAIRNPQPGTVKRIHTKSEATQAKVIGSLEKDKDNQNIIGLDMDIAYGLPNKYLTDLISFEDIRKSNGDMDYLVEHNGFKHVGIKTGPLSRWEEDIYWYKNCVVKNKKVVPSGQGTSVLISLGPHMAYSDFEIEVFNDVAFEQLKSEFLTQVDEQFIPEGYSYSFKWANGEKCEQATIIDKGKNKGGIICIMAPY